MVKIVNWLRLAMAYVRLNLLSHLEYRGAFLSQALAMMLNDAIWIVFWTLFFNRFHVLRGWTQTDVLTIWAICTSGFGLAVSLAGNSIMLARIILRGELDAWLLYPRALLPHVLLGRMGASAFGDALFGYVLFIFMVRPDLQHFLLFVLFTISAAMIFTGFFVLTGSLGFLVGNAEILAEQWQFSLITFSTYPGSLFEGGVRILLFTVLPAGFVSYLPVEAMHTMSPILVSEVLLGAIAILAIGVSAFYLGLRRYESGNLMEMKG